MDYSPSHISIGTKSVFLHDTSKCTKTRFRLVCFAICELARPSGVCYIGPRPVCAKCRYSSVRGDVGKQESENNFCHLFDHKSNKAPSRPRSLVDISMGTWDVYPAPFALGCVQIENFGSFSFAIISLIYPLVTRSESTPEWHPKSTIDNGQCFCGALRGLLRKAYRDKKSWVESMRMCCCHVWCQRASVVGGRSGCISVVHASTWARTHCIRVGVITQQHSPSFIKLCFY